MHGLKKYSSLAVLIWLLAAVAATEGIGQNKKPAAPQLTGSATMFAGWRGELAIIQREDSLENGRIKDTYYSIGPGSRRVSVAGTHQPSNLAIGTVLVRDYEPLPNTLALVFNLDVDEKESRALREALNAWWEKGEGKLQDFPEVHATFRIVLADRELWVKKGTLTASMGEAGYEYRPPKLRFATLSPSRAVLLVELTGSDGSDFVRMSVPPNVLQ
jgi:hypothetical protein